MKKIILLLLLIPCLGFCQLRDSVRIKTEYFEILYNENLEQPLEVKYKVLCPNGKASRKGMDFYTNDTIHTSDHADYVQNEFDKGHLAPAADFKCDPKMLYATFSYLNCALQHQDLNRGVWKFLEAEERSLAEKQDVIVKVDVIFDSNTRKLPSGATVPTGFRKTLYLPLIKEKRVYYFPNSKPTKADFGSYLIEKFLEK